MGHSRSPLNAAVTLTPAALPAFLLNVALVRPVFLWGPPGIGKSSLVRRFADEVGLPCVSMLGSQLAPEDLIGVPQIVDGKSVFCPPRMIARDAPYCLFLDELNAASAEVMKAFYSLILERRIGEYHLPEGSVVVGAGNRTQDQAIVRPMPSALVNRMIHVHLRASHRDWLAWAYGAEVHPWVVEYIEMRPDQLWSAPPKHEEPFSTPRAWHMMSDVLKEFGPNVPDAALEALAFGCLSPAHATGFRAFVRGLASTHRLGPILKGDAPWPADPGERDILYFLAHSFRAQLVKGLPVERQSSTAAQKELAMLGKARLVELATISLEIAQMVVGETDDGESLPDWFLVEIARDLPRLAARRG